MEDLGRDVLALLDSVGAARVHFCGLSMGGMIGMWMGIHASHRLEKLALAHTAARIGSPTLWNERIDTVRSRGMKAISDAAIARWFTADFIASQPDTVSELKAAMERTSAEGYVHCCAAIRDTDHREAITRIKAPTLIITGARDIATPPDDGRFLAQHIAGSQLVEIDAAHLSNIESSREFNEALLSFFTSALRPAPASTTRDDRDPAVVPRLTIALVEPA